MRSKKVPPPFSVLEITETFNSMPSVVPVTHHTEAGGLLESRNYSLKQTLPQTNKNFREDSLVD